MAQSCAIAMVLTRPDNTKLSIQEAYLFTDKHLCHGLYLLRHVSFVSFEMRFVFLIS